MRKIESLLTALMLMIVISAFAPTIRAQEPWEDPESGNEQIDRRTGQLKAKSSPALPEQIQIMSRVMTGLMEFLQSEVVAYMSTWAMYMAQLLSGLILLFSFLRVWRENSGKGENLYWWFARLGICLGLLTSSIFLINEMVGVGKDIAVGSSTNSVVFRFYDRMQSNFTESYAKIAQNTFKVRIPGEQDPFAVKPIDSAEQFLGVIFDQQGTVRDFNNHLKDSTWLMPKLFAWLGACRGILEFGDLWLMTLSGVVLLGIKVFAPIAVALAIDQRLAQRISYQFLWGTIVLTIIWPTVSYFIRGLAYMFGNVAMSLGDSAPVYVWNEATFQAFRSVQSQPVYTVLFACFTMTIAALCLWLSPVIAYQLSTGRIYEGISNAASTFAGAMIGTAIELYSSISAAKYSQEAAQMQANAGYESDTKRAGGERRAADLATGATRELSVSQVKANQIAQLASTYANLGFQKKSIESDRSFQIVGNLAQARLTNKNIEAGLTKDKEENRISTGQQIRNSGGDAVGGAYSIGGGALGSILGGPGGAVPLGSAVSSYIQLKGNEKRMDMHQDASLEAQKERNTNLETVAGAQQLNQDKFAIEMNAGTNRRAAALVGAAQVSAQQTAGGINRSTTIQLGGIDRSTEMHLQANQVRYDAQVEAAGITRGAAIEAARLHAIESVIRSMGSKIARDIEGGMVLRY